MQSLFYERNTMKTNIIPFKDLEPRQAFHNPENPDFDNPFSKLGDKTFVEKHSCSHVWHIDEELWPKEGVMIIL